MQSSLVSRWLAEFLGVAGIVATVIGASHMASDLSSTADMGLLINAVATGAVLFTLITIFASVSGSHFNPAVTLVFYLRREISLTDSLAYLSAQFAGGVFGAVTANLMFGRLPVGPSSNVREGLGLYLGEMVATIGLILLILLLVQQQKTSVIPAAVAGWIVAGYFFTSSTSFANPAVTFGRAFSDAGGSIAWESVPGFIAAQILAALTAALVFKLIFQTKREDQ